MIETAPTRAGSEPGRGRRQKGGYADGMSASRINAGLGTIVQKVLERLAGNRSIGLYTAERIPW
ncbi:MAG: hypothetical protein ACLR0U_27725 [Enterocloster clostridioformis]